MIERVNMDTRERIVVLTQGVHHPYDVKYFNGFLYWTDWATSSLKVSELSIHHESAHLIHSFTTLPYGLAINHTMFQDQSHVGVAWMKERCLEGDGCLNGGQCQDIKNEHGRVVKIVCSLPPLQIRAQIVAVFGYGYEKDQDGDCAPIDVTSMEDENGKSLVEKNEPKDQSHVGVAWMKERCLEGDGCLNGGQCQDIKNEHGRVVKIVCSCEIPYEGHRCERLNPEKALAAQLKASPRPLWITSFFLLLFITFLIAAFIISYRYQNVLK
ncbi:unnamed protein product [Strongylus vulgaris]|uniref:EGF-like domain-containing protein n=1 Tax=Strongylus vulgaris TaxID=40348 RepID=A0A3P7LHE4_STRVU|nr:unnamed protein product [Strongylus vulgaris]